MSHRAFRPALDRMEMRTLLSTFTVVDSGDSGPGTLRQAILDANAHGGCDTVDFATGFSGTITLTSGELDITDDLTINGPGRASLTVRDDNASIVFHVERDAKVTLSEMTISDGCQGVFNSGTLAVTDCTIKDNGGFVAGAGIASDEDTVLTVTRSTIEGNSAEFGGGVWSFGGSVTVIDSIIANNASAEDVGGMGQWFGTLTVLRSTIENNHAAALYGGGIYVGASTVAQMQDSVIANNSSAGWGTGIYDEPFGQLTMTNCTVSGNQGGIAVVLGSPTTMMNCTIARNRNDSSFAGGLAAGLWDSPDARLVNVLVAGNTADDVPADIFGAVRPDSMNNLIGDAATAGGLSNGVNCNIVGVADLSWLSTLSDNGGPTQTIAIAPGSLAIDAGISSVPGFTVPTDDQRGALRGPGGVNAGTAPDIGAFEYSAAATVSSTATPAQVQSFIQDVAPTGGSVTLQTTSNAAVSTSVQAINAIPSPPDPQNNPVNVTLDLSNGTYTTDTHIAAQPGVTVTIVNGTLIGGSPALIVDSGAVILDGVTALNATNAPTIVINGGSLIVRNSIIQESSGFTLTALQINGGIVDLGTATDPGNNVVNVNGAGQWAINASGHPIPAVGTTFTVNGAVAPSSLSGVVFSDFNDDGQVDFGEQGILGVPITLTGTDFLGNPVSLCQHTDSDGTYVFQSLLPGSYTITETQQPAGYTSGINTVGTGGGTVSGAQFTVAIMAGQDAMNYNYGEQPAATGSIKKGQTAGIGFWNNKNGQALIKSLNGGTGHQLGDWLAATFPHLFGSLAGANDLAGKSNTFIAALFQSDFVVHGQKLDAQVLATALAVYVTDPTLDSTGVGTQYGFLVGGNGVATSTVNVGSNGAAFGVANNTVLTVLDILLAADAQAVNGVLYNGDATKRNQANTVFSAINEAGGL